MFFVYLVLLLCKCIKLIKNIINNKIFHICLFHNRRPHATRPPCTAPLCAAIQLMNEAKAAQQRQRQKRHSAQKRTKNKSQQKPLIKMHFHSGRQRCYRRAPFQFPPHLLQPNTGRTLPGLCWRLGCAIKGIGLFIS